MAKLKPLSELARKCNEGDLILLRRVDREEGLPVYVARRNPHSPHLLHLHLGEEVVVFDTAKEEISIRSPIYQQKHYTHYEILRKAKKEGDK